MILNINLSGLLYLSNNKKLQISHYTLFYVLLTIFQTCYFSFETISYKYKIHEMLIDYVTNCDNN